MKRTVLATIAALAILPAAAHADPSPRGVEKATGYYLALGDSLAAGYQPGMGDDKTGGYVGGVLDAVRAQSPKTKLVNLACSGETVATMVSGGRCAYEAGSQFDQALDHHMQEIRRRALFDQLALGWKRLVVGGRHQPLEGVVTHAREQWQCAHSALNRRVRHHSSSRTAAPFRKSARASGLRRTLSTAGGFARGTVQAAVLLIVWRGKGQAA